MSSDDIEPTSLTGFSIPKPRAGKAYLVRPGEDGEGTGPGVIVLQSWWGSSAEAKEYCHRLADEGFVVVMPDIMGGALPLTAAEAELELAETDPNETAALILSSTVAIRAASGDPSKPVAIIGFSMGASWALWAAARQPESYDKAVVFYGTQNIDFSLMTSRVQGHFPEIDSIVSPDQLLDLEADLFEHGFQPEFWHYEGVKHWFAESGVADYYDADAAELAWSRTLEFLRS